MIKHLMYSANLLLLLFYLLLITDLHGISSLLSTVHRLIEPMLEDILKVIKEKKKCHSERWHLSFSEHLFSLSVIKDKINISLAEQF